MSQLRYSVPVALLAACSLDERTLTYGQGVGSASHGASANQGSESGAGGEEDDGHGGSGASEPDSGGAPAEGGGPGQSEAGMGAGAVTAGSGATSAGGSSSGGGGSGSGATGGGGAGGAAGGGGGSSAGTSGSTTGGAGSGGIDPDAGTCGDLDRNSVQDCDETLVQNPSFATSGDQWAVEYGATQAWQAEDARGRAGSGSLSLTSTKASSPGVWSSAGSGQCLVATSGQVVELDARALIPSGQGQGHGRVGLIIYGNDGCQGTVLASVTTGTVTTAGAWQAIGGKTKLPPATRSIYVRLMVEKPAAASAFEVRFDDVLVRKD